MGTGEPNAGGNPAMDQHPIQGNTPGHFTLRKPGYCSNLVGYRSYADLTFLSEDFIDQSA